MTKRIFAPLLLPLLLFAGCIKDNRENCDAGLWLHYSYTLNPQDEERVGSDVNVLTILVFDGDGLFYRSFSVDDPALLGNDNAIYLPLPAGRWNIVTWGGDGDMGAYAMGVVEDDGETILHGDGHEAGVTHIEDHRLWVANYEMTEDGSKLVTEHLTNLYHGTVSGVETRIGVETYRDVPMIDNLNKLKVVLSGLPPLDTRGGSTQSIGVVADMVNGRCRHDNEICVSARNVRYDQGAGVMTNDNTMQFDLSVMRLFAHDAASAITVSGPILEECGYPDGRIVIPIVPTVMQSDNYNTQADLDREKLYTFELEFDAKMDFTLTVNGWNVMDVVAEPEI